MILKGCEISRQAVGESEEETSGGSSLCPVMW